MRPLLRSAMARHGATIRRMPSQLTGACVCGAVRYEIDAPLLDAGYCHCTRCQRRTGTGSSAQARVAPGAFRLVAGEEHVRRWEPPGGGYVKAFCSQCGSALLSHAPGDPVATVSVRLGTVDGDPGVRPSYRQRTETAAVWEPLPEDGLQHFPGPRP